MTKLAGDGQSAAVGTAVATRPAVKVTDQTGAAVSGLAVTFAVASGGGTLTGASATTGSDGVATVGSWTLGATAGVNTLSASASGVVGSPVTFTATGTAATATAMTKQAGDNQNGTVGTAVAVAPSVKLVDGTGSPVAGVSVTFSVATGGGAVTGGSATTNALGIATVGGWTLGPAAGTNTLTATATGSGISGNPATFTATAALAAFSPTSNTSLAGAQSFASMSIPAGVTVTLTADATITVTGAVTLAGTLSGNCVNLSLTTTGTLTTTGVINTSCPGGIPGSGAPSLTMVATGGYQIGGTITTSGNINITNDATLTDATFAAPPVGGLRAGGASLRQVGVCIVGNANFTASPVNATAGNNGQFGTKGADASTWTLQCTGELDVTGGLTVVGQNGGAGGTGTHSSAVAALATGGQGGIGGTIRVRANNGDLVLNGTGNTITSGNGGAGGAATATGTNGGNPAASANATGGAGNIPGNIVLQAKGGGISIGSVTLTMGNGGAGGTAIATGATGLDALPCNPGVGGAATAAGGAGGNTPDKTLTATGSVSGLGGVTVNGGNPGVGGNATATGGGGGAGAQPCKNGAAGGAQSATGGRGGNALIKNAAGALIANGGNGGSMEDAGGNGGAGWADCRSVLEAGGAGGVGGVAGGANGAGGTGLANGTPGSAKFNIVANGGNGGDGSGPGGGGSAGGSTANITVVATTIQPSFTNGLPGAACVPQLKLKFSAIANTGGAVAAGTQVIPVQDASNSTDVGTIPYVTSGNTFVSTTNSPAPRVGIAANSGHVGLGIGSVIVNAKAWVATKVNVCVVNAPGVNSGNPITVQPKTAAGTPTGPPQTITSQTCQDVTWPTDAQVIDMFGPVGADFFFAIFGHAPD